MNTEMFLRGWKYFLLLFRTGKPGIGCYIFLKRLELLPGAWICLPIVPQIPGVWTISGLRQSSVLRRFDNMEYTHVTSFFSKMSPKGSYPEKLFLYEKGRKGKKIWKSVVPNPLLPFVIVSVVDTWYKRINMLYCSHYTSFCYQMAMIQLLTYPDLSPRWWDVTDYSLSLPFATLSPRQKPIRFLLEYIFL